MKPGTKVKMSEELKQAFIANQCSEHVKEFGNCIGVVIGLIDYQNGNVGPEVNVRWFPSCLRYAYNPKDLIEVP